MEGVVSTSTSTKVCVGVTEPLLSSFLFFTVFIFGLFRFPSIYLTLRSGPVGTMRYGRNKNMEASGVVKKKIELSNCNSKDVMMMVILGACLQRPGGRSVSTTLSVFIGILSATLGWFLNGIILKI